MFIARLAAFTIALVLMVESFEDGWGVEPAWGWYVLLCLFAVLSFSFLSLIVWALSGLLLLGIVDESRAAFIVLTVFAGAALLRSLLIRGEPRWQARSWSWRSGGREGD